MPAYDIKCYNGHYSEIFQTISNFRSDHICPKCNAEAKVVIRQPGFFWVDNVQDVDYTVTAGRNFSNRQERDAWLSANGYHIPPADDTVMMKMFEDLDNRKELRREIESRGGSWEAHLAQEAYEKAKKDYEAAKDLSVISSGREEDLKAWAEQGGADLNYGGMDGFDAYKEAPKDEKGNVLEPDFSNADAEFAAMQEA